MYWYERKLTLPYIWYERVWHAYNTQFSRAWYYICWHAYDMQFSRTCDTHPPHSPNLTHRVAYTPQSQIFLINTMNFHFDLAYYLYTLSCDQVGVLPVVLCQHMALLMFFLAVFLWFSLLIVLTCFSCHVISSLFIVPLPSCFCRFGVILTPSVTVFVSVCGYGWVCFPVSLPGWSYALVLSSPL